MRREDRLPTAILTLIGLYVLACFTLILTACGAPTAPLPHHECRVLVKATLDARGDTIIAVYNTYPWPCS